MKAIRVFNNKFLFYWITDLTHHALRRISAIATSAGLSRSPSHLQLEKTMKPQSQTAPAEPPSRLWTIMSIANHTQDRRPRPVARKTALR
ncbi:hypothetical protein PHAMO_270274 [Magnetospirillum molischianum DSM 120]|uniref:Uncharacterized protein n=1 Tax=Magnetospirillum molischianum DSM 120 TaxID=1150626 RepID=H8FSU5_MAGML|nr:hypothetical protein PHAMO_270274 [Magnetospirillum molischianum DSM 120]